VHSEVGRIISPGHEWFMRGDKIVLIDKVPSGFTYSHDTETEFSVESHTVGFSELSPYGPGAAWRNTSPPGILVTDEAGQFVKKSFLGRCAITQRPHAFNTTPEQCRAMFIRGQELELQGFAREKTGVRVDTTGAAALN
jgi:hypothetical protein